MAKQRKFKDPPSTTTTTNSCSHTADHCRQDKHADRPVNNLQLLLNGPQEIVLVDTAADSFALI